MPTEDNPTGLAYFKTYQALFQMIESFMLLVAWALLASQKYYQIAALSFSLAVFVIIWLITLFFFLTYITGLHQKINSCLANISNKPRPSSAGTAGSLAPPEEAHRLVPSGVAWFVVEYIAYFICDIFLFIAVCIVTSKAGNNSHYIASYAFGWLTLIVYILHFCLLVKNTEGAWPHAVASDCCKRISKPKSNSESEKLLSSPDQPSGQP